MLKYLFLLFFSVAVLSTKSVIFQTFDGKCLAVKGDSNIGASLEYKECENATVFRIKDNSLETYNGLCLSINKHNKCDNFEIPVKLSLCDGSKRQKWDIPDMEEGYLISRVISSALSSKFNKAYITNLERDAIKLKSLEVYMPENEEKIVLKNITTLRGLEKGFYTRKNSSGDTMSFKYSENAWVLSYYAWSSKKDYYLGQGYSDLDADNFDKAYLLEIISLYNMPNTIKIKIRGPLKTSFRTSSFLFS